MSEKLTRRDFVKFTSLALAGWALEGCLPQAELFLQPEIIHDTEVYGLKEAIETEDQVIRLYRFLDQKFTAENYLQNERYLEVVVRKSAYDSFLARRDETGVDFVEWIKMHRDALNVCLKNAKPSVDTQAVLKRIIVIDDDLPQGFWDEAVFRQGQGYALDAIWWYRFKSDFPRDTDASWAIADDYRVDTTKEEAQSYFWSFKHEEGKLIFGWPPGAPQYQKTYEYPDEDNSMSGATGVWLDFGLIHEWSHYLLNLPDQSSFNLENENPSRFSNFFVVTGRSFLEPYLSPYLAHFLNANTAIPGRRRYYFERKAFDFSDRPHRIFLAIEGGNVRQVNIHKVILKDGYRGAKIFSSTPDQVSDQALLALAPQVFDNQLMGAHLWLLRIRTDAFVKDLFLPSAAFQISKFAGLELSAGYRITLMEDSLQKKDLILEIVDESDLEANLDKHVWVGDIPYALMEVDGTSTWFAWFLKDQEI